MLRLITVCVGGALVGLSLRPDMNSIIVGVIGVALMTLPEHLFNRA